MTVPCRPAAAGRPPRRRGRAGPGAGRGPRGAAVDLRADDDRAVPALLRALARGRAPPRCWPSRTRRASSLARLGLARLRAWGVRRVAAGLLPRGMADAYVVHFRDYQTADYDGDVEDP